jgi:hypothetical protein
MLLQHPSPVQQLPSALLVSAVYGLHASLEKLELGESARPSFASTNLSPTLERAESLKCFCSSDKSGLRSLISIQTSPPLQSNA